MKSVKIDVSELTQENKLKVLDFLVEAGYKKSSNDWKPLHIEKTGYFIAYAPPKNIEWDYIDNWDKSLHGGIESISFDQLRDLVVLKRNDVKDANYKGATDFYYVTVENKYYFWNGFAWCLSDADFISGLSPIIDNPEPQDPALISGAEAKLAWAKGEQLQIDTGCGFEELTDNYYLGIFDRQSNKFRLKPQAIKIELELPKPFEPKVGDEYFCINDSEVVGWTRYVCDEVVNPQDFNFGVWRTEAEIKQVVEQLRKIRGV